MAIEFDPLIHPAPGVNQLGVSLGRGAQMPLPDAIALFEAVPGVKGAGAIGGMWPRGYINLSLESPVVSAELRHALVGVCQQILAAG